MGNGTRFSWKDFQVNVTWFFACFSGVLDWVVLILVWLERSLHSAQVSEESCPWPLKLMTSQWVERTWIRTGGYGRFRGEWVNKLHLNYKLAWHQIFGLLVRYSISISIFRPAARIFYRRCDPTKRQTKQDRRAGESRLSETAFRVFWKTFNLQK